MDLIGQLAGQLGIEPSAAKALAGTVLGGAQEQMAEHVGKSEATQFAEAIPELGDWKAQAGKLLGAGDSEGSVGGLMGALSGALGGGEGAGGGLMGALGGALGGAAGGQGGALLAATTAVLGKLDLNPSVISTVAPLVSSFLEERLPASLLDKVKMVAPFLGGGGGGGGGAGGLLGSLLGG